MKTNFWYFIINNLFYSSAIDSPLKCIEQIQLFNYLKKKFNSKISKDNMIEILKGSIDVE